MQYLKRRSGRETLAEFLLCLAVAGWLSGCSVQNDGPSRTPAWSSAQSDDSSALTPTLEQLANASYAGIRETPVQLSDGRFQGPPFVAGAASRPVVELVTEHIAFGDVDADGSEEAVLTLVASSGGSGSHVYLAVVGLRQGRAENLATILLGDRVRVRSLDIFDGRVRSQLVEHGPGDPACCPTRRRSREWLLRGRNLVQTTAEETDRLSASDLAGDQICRGHLVWGHEVRSFTECDSRREGWVVDATGHDLTEVYGELTSEPYQPLFVEIRGRWRPAPREGFGADYAEQFEVVELRRAARESKGCAEDLAGIDYVASGNEPFWTVEIRKTGVLFSALGRFERLEFPPPHVAITSATTVFVSERAGQDPDRIEIELTVRRCTDSMSGSRFSFAAIVRVDGSTFEGCALAGW